MPFQPGQSGNPSGRPKENAEVKALAASLCIEAIEGLAAIARDPKAPHSARNVAWQAILDRGLGKPTQAIEHSGAEGGPLGFVLMGQPEAKDAGAWRSQHGPPTGG